MNLGRQIVVFGLSNAASRLAAILLVPLYTRALPVREYGQLEVLLALYTLFVLIVGLQGESAVARDYYEVGEGDERAQLKVGSLVMAFAGTVCLAVAMVLGALFGLWPVDISPALPWLLAMTVLTQILGIQFVILRFAGRPVFFAFVSFLDLFLSAAASAALILGFHLGITGALAGITIAKGVCTLVAWPPAFGTSIAVAPGRAMLARMTSYALPTMPSVLLNWLQTNGNRVLLAAFLTLSDVAIAGVAVKVAALYGFLTYAFRLAWEPWSFGQLGRFQEDRGVFVRAFQIYAVAMSAVAAAATIASPLIVAILAPGTYAAATKLSGLFILGQFWIGAVPILAIGVHGARVTSRLTYIYLLGAIVNVAAIALLPGLIGVTSAAIGYLASAMITACAAAWYSNRHFGTGFSAGLLWWLGAGTVIFGTISYVVLASIEGTGIAMHDYVMALGGMLALSAGLIALLARFCVDRGLLTDAISTALRRHPHGVSAG